MRGAATLLALALASPATAEEPIRVFAASSLQTVLGELAAIWEGTDGAPILAAYGGSPAQARQIAQGAPADLFFSASSEWMDWLAGQGMIHEGTRRDLLGNRLALIAPAPQGAPVEIGPGFPLSERLGGGPLAMALTEAVPAGIYGRQALISLELWESVRPRVAEAENVRAALALVALGEAPLGIVYETDALAEPRVAVIGTFPEESHGPIVYPVAIAAGSAHPEAAAFLAFLASPGAAAIFAEAGFVILPGPS
jgi:molybdate transport system substrate-binding protein